MKLFEFKTDFPCLTLKELTINEGTIFRQNGHVTISNSEEIVIRQVDGLVQVFVRPTSGTAVSVWGTGGAAAK